MSDYFQFIPAIQDIITEALRSSDGDFTMLDTLLPKGLLEKSLTMIEQEKFHIIRGLPSQKDYYHYRGSNPMKPTDFFCSKHYCPCDLFKSSLRENHEIVICPHILAVMIINYKSISIPVDIKDDKDIILQISNKPA
ncbi:hypothetical protein WA158_004617 [Blastocystis sp. Blastoise]